jgi:hypothetical protein
VRVEDATVTERYAFNLDLTSVEEWKSMAESMGVANMVGRHRFQEETSVELSMSAAQR